MKKIFFAFGLLVLAGMGCQGNAAEVAVNISSPVAVDVGEAFEIRVALTNTDEEDHVLDSIDIGTSYQEGIVLVSSEPEYTDTFHIPIDNTTSHSFGVTIPAGETIDVIFNAIAYSSGTYTGDFDVCIDSGIACQFLSVSTNVNGDEAFDLSLDLADYVLTVESPEQVSVGDVVELKASITNNKDTEALLDSIDIAEEYIAGVEISSASPVFTDFFTLETDNTRSHQFGTPIPAGETLEVTFFGTAVAPGTYEGAFDVCVDIGYNCFFETVRTEVVE